MGSLFTFNQTVKGYLHVLRNVECEDYSISFSDEKASFYTAVVADGHGAEVCFRSAQGAEIACRITDECFREFAESVTSETFCDSRNTQITLRRLTDTIAAKWYDRVFDHYKNNPPNENQSEKFDPHIYGTTVIGALMLPEYLVLVHQGDGRCEVFYDDGTVDQPIPWDERCQDNVTTSLCDTDVSESFRSIVIDLKKKNVIACYLGCDGVEDAYRDTYDDLGGTHGIMGGVHAFYKDLTCKIIDMGQAAFKSQLNEYLETFSKSGRFSPSGSGDDVSVAGIVNMEACRAFYKSFSIDAELYDAEEQLFLKQNEIKGKQRKYEILRRRMYESQAAFENLNDTLSQQKKDRTRCIEQKNKKGEENKPVIDCIGLCNQVLLESCDENRSITMDNRFPELLQKIKSILLINPHEKFDENLSPYVFRRYVNQLEATRDKHLHDRDYFENQCQKLTREIEKNEKLADEKKQEYLKAKELFDTYNEKYQEIEEDVKQLTLRRDELLEQRRVLTSVNDNSNKSSINDNKKHEPTELTVEAEKEPESKTVETAVKNDSEPTELTVEAEKEPESETVETAVINDSEPTELTVEAEKEAESKTVETAVTNDSEPTELTVEAEKEAESKTVETAAPNESSFINRDEDCEFISENDNAEYDDSNIIEQLFNKFNAALEESSSSEIDEIELDISEYDSDEQED